MKSNIDKGRIKDLVQGAPKAQLHLHLDGSLSFNFITAALKRLEERNKNVIIFEKNWQPSNEEELMQWFRNMKKTEQEKGWKVAGSQNWNIFTVCNYFLQTKIDLFEATYDLLTRLAYEHNVNYIEIRFAPILHTNEGLSEEDAVKAVIDGFDQAVFDINEKFNKIVEGGIILCGLRSYPVEQLMQTVILIQSVKNKRMLGFDIAGDEKTYPLKLFEDVLKFAVSNGIKTTVHAGEWDGVKSPDVIDNLKLAVELGVNRIGHGLALGALKDDDDLFTGLKEKNISVEICLTGNCSHPDKCASFQHHPLLRFLSNDIAISGLNVDNLLLSGNAEVGCPNPTGEILRAIFDCGIKSEGLLRIIKNSYRTAFMKLPEAFIESSLKIWKENVLSYL